MKRISIAIILIILLVQSISYTDLIRGVDISALHQIEDNGGSFSEDGIQKDVLEILSDHHINFVRLRIWHTPDDNYCNLEKTLMMAERIKNMGFGFLLDFHYSDTWADPGNQSKPAAWNLLSFSVLEDSLYHYTYKVIDALKSQNTLPDIVQIGNEITCGMLWNEGKVCDRYNTPEQWARFGNLLDHAIRGVEDCCTEDDSVRIMIHVDEGGNNATCRWFFDKLLAQNVDFDIIGLSYYPWWHGTLNDLDDNITNMSECYQKDVIVVETVYPWTLDWFDDTHNIVGDSAQLLAGYPATVEGQKKFLTDIIHIIKDTPGERGLGLFYWAPEWISTSQFGSPWENLALFDFQGEVLGSITVFDSCCVDNIEEE